MTGKVNLAYYQKKDWKRFLEIIDDRDRMHETWELWCKDFLKLKKDLIDKGFIVEDYKIDLHELRDFCLQRGIKIDGKARSQFVSNR